MKQTTKSKMLRHIWAARQAALASARRVEVFHFHKRTMALRRLTRGRRGDGD